MQTFRSTQRKISDYVFLGAFEKLTGVKLPSYVKTMKEALCFAESNLDNIKFPFSMEKDSVEIYYDDSDIVRFMINAILDKDKPKPNDLFDFMDSYPDSYIVCHDSAFKGKNSLFILTEFISDSELNNENTLVLCTNKRAKIRYLISMKSYLK